MASNTSDFLHQSSDQDSINGEQLLKERFQELMNVGKTVQATSPNVDINKKPEYFDEALFNKAQKTCLKYYTNLSMSSSTGLILLLQIRSVVVPLLITGKSRTVANLYDRYVATARYIRNCYESRFHEQDSIGWKNIVLVRSLHARIHELMKKNERFSKAGSEVWVNQYDMAMTQFAFVGLFLTNPAKCGAYNVSDEELMDVAYMWRLLSYYFGIEERFNLFVYHDNLQQQIAYMKRILFHINDLLKSSRLAIGTRMAEGFMLAFEDFTTESTFNILDHWWSPVISLSGLTQLKPYTLSERWKLVFFQFYFNVLFRSDFFLGLINSLYKWKFDKFEAAADVVRPKLMRKYSELTYELPE